MNDTIKEQYLRPFSEEVGIGALSEILQMSGPVENPGDGGEWGWD